MIVIKRVIRDACNQGVIWDVPVFTHFTVLSRHKLEKSIKLLTPEAKSARINFDKPFADISL